ncbi:glycosyltransferase [Neisseria sp.]|uniref:glycosyltransferase n=1 Tax=Neisseria sp. TaxID=192066 RepID=UPI00359F310E
MHVLIIPSWYPSTPDDVDGIFFRKQAHALQRSGLQIGVIAPVFRSLRGKPASVLTGGYGIRSFIDEDVPTYIYKSMYFFPRMPRDRARWIKAGKKLFQRYVRAHGRPDIIHAHAMNYGGVLAYEISCETGIPYVVTEHSSTYARKLIWDWQWPEMRQAAAHAAARIAVSRDFAALLEQEYQQQQAWQYIPNIVTEMFMQPVDFAVKPQNQHFTFCSVAHFHYKKGFDILLKAFALALKKHPDLKLKIGGGGAEDAKLRALAAELGLNHAVRFLGSLKYPQVLELMRSSDAFVLASRNETFGVVFIEALSQGLPVVATRCGGPESIVTPGNGCLVPSENIGELADALVELYENRSRYDAHTLRENCLAEFGEQAVTAKITAVYRDVLARSAQKQEQP